MKAYRCGKKAYRLREFRCEVCGNLAIAGKAAKKMTRIGHKKRLWCYKCKEVTQHIQIGLKGDGINGSHGKEPIEIQKVSGYGDNSSAELAGDR